MVQTDRQLIVFCPIDYDECCIKNESRLWIMSKNKMFLNGTPGITFCQ